MITSKDILKRADHLPPDFAKKPSAIRNFGHSILGIFLLIGMFLGQLVGFSEPAQAQQTAFPPCSSNVYLAQNGPTQLFAVETGTNPFTYPNIGAVTAFTYNAIAMDPTRNYIYGTTRTAGGNVQLLRVGAGGGAFIQGDISGVINQTPGNPASGEIGPNGVYYLKHNGAADKALYRVNIDTRTATRVEMSQGRSSADLAWHNGLLYSADADGIFYSINPTSGVVAEIGRTNVAGQFGGMIGASNGVFGFNNNGGFYQFDLTTGNATLISAAPPSSNNDAAKCVTTPLTFGVDLAITKTNNRNYFIRGASTTYDIVVRNNGPFGVQGALVNDALPAGITNATWTCTANTAGASCGTDIGSGAITNRLVNLPVNGSVTFQMTIQVPASYAGTTLVNTATVTAPDTATETITNNNSATDTDTYVTAIKDLTSEDGNTANFAEVGELLSYRVRLQNLSSNAASNYAVNDQLDPNVEFVSASDGGVLDGNVVRWTGLAIAANATRDLTVVTRVKSNLPDTATKIVNRVYTEGEPIPNCPSAQCPEIPIKPQVSYSKSTDSSSVKIGSTIRYTLRSIVRHGPTRDAVTLIDTLGTGLSFQAITAPGLYNCTEANGTITCILPAGTAIGTHDISYTALVTNAATQNQVENSVVGTGGDDPSCAAGSCVTTTPIVSPTVSYSKTATPDGPVSAGDVIDYTLTVTVSDNFTTSDVVLLTDTLGGGLEYMGVTSNTGFIIGAQSANQVAFTLPANAGPNTYSITYRARVTDTASGSVANNVVGTGTDNPVCVNACGTTTTVKPANVTYRKISTIVANGDQSATQVERDQRIDYSIIVTVADAATSDDYLFEDILGEGLSFNAFGNQTDFTCAPPSNNSFSCTLPTGAAVGEYRLDYSALVTGSAGNVVGNTVTGTSTTGPQPSCLTAGECSTETPVAAPAVSFGKSANSQAPVSVGDSITYDLIITVAKSATRNELTLTDALPAGLRFQAIVDNGILTCTGTDELSCILPAGTPTGSYTVRYSALVTSAAGASLVNAVTGSGDDNPTCDPVRGCQVTTDVIEPAVTVGKSASTADPVAVGETIVYTIVVNVAQSATRDTLTLTDTLGEGLELLSINNGSFTCTAVTANALVCTLPAGTAPESYQLSYTARVTEDAVNSVTNMIVPTGGDNPDCDSCSTTNDVRPSITVGKSLNQADEAVGFNDEIAYRITVTVSHANTQDDLTLTDNFGTGLTFVEVTENGSFACNSAAPLACVLPANSPPGVYTLEYSASVNKDAVGTVLNTVTPTTTDIVTCTTCGVETEVKTPAVTVSKSSSATFSKVGDEIIYTLTATVTDMPTRHILTLTDTPGTGLSLANSTIAQGQFTCTNSNGELICTLPAGTLAGSYDVSYTVLITTDARNSVRNAVIASGDDSPDCSSCEVTTSLASKIAYSKSSDAGQQVSPGDIINYTIQVVVSEAATTSLLTLTDTLGDGLTLQPLQPQANFTCIETNPLVCTLPAGTAIGTYSFTYSAVVGENAGAFVNNSVDGSGDDSPQCANATCEVTTPVVPPSIAVTKAADATGPVSAGETITYTVTAIVSASATRDDLTLTDTLGAGLVLTSVTNGRFNCTQPPANPLVCTLPTGTPAGTYPLIYTADVTDTAEGSVSNVVIPSTNDDVTCTDCSVTTPIKSNVSYRKSSTTTSAVSAGTTIPYLLEVIVADAPTTDTLTLLDTMDDGLTIVTPINDGAFDCTSTTPLQCTLPAGTGIGTYSISYNAVVDADAAATVRNTLNVTGADEPRCALDGACTVVIEVEAPDVSVAKTAATTGRVTVGSLITYTLTATVANSATRHELTLTDKLGTGLLWGEVTDIGEFNCNNADPLICTLPAGKAPGSYAITYTARVTADAADGVVNNSVEASGDDEPRCTNCTVTTPIGPVVTYSKVSETTGAVRVGESIAYAINLSIANAATTDDITITDVLGAGLRFGSVTDAAGFTCGAGSGGMECTVPSGTAVGSYTIRYTALVTDSATDQVINTVTATGGDEPSCAAAGCSVTTTISPLVTFSKTSNTNGPARAGDEIIFTVTTTIANAQSTSATLLLTDTLGTGLTLVTVTDAGAYIVDDSQNPVVTFTLPAGTAPGTYAVVYNARVTNAALGTVGNVVEAEGDDAPSCAAACSTAHEVINPVVSVSKSATPDNGEQVLIGQTLEYSLNVSVANSATQAELVLIDTPDAGLTLGTLPTGCAMLGSDIRCTLPENTPVGDYSFAYSATVNERAGTNVGNSVTASGGGGLTDPSCTNCTTSHQVLAPMLRVVKNAAVRSAKIGDLVRYSLTIENLGASPFIAGSILDTPPAGFTYVEGSAVIQDGDNAGQTNGFAPLRFENIDVAAGGTATIQYLMRVGAGVRRGNHINQAQAYSANDEPVSNIASAQISLESDPMMDEALIFGTVFDDRDGDGWQDMAHLSGLTIKGGFASTSYVAGSTTVDRGQGPQSVPDASAPLLKGIKLGRLAARQSDVDAPREIIIRQRLTTPDLTDDFTLSNDQGVTLTMNRDGQTHITRMGDAAKGLNSALPTAERRILPDGNAYVVEYVIRNMGVDERGIPGVRLASVEGLLIETDQYGRYHLVGIEGGASERGRNFILKLDPATLPEGAALTTRNPLLRRITPGLPVRFDWGVKLPVHIIKGGSQEVEVKMGSIAFAPRSTTISAEAQQRFTELAAALAQYGAGELIIEASGEDAPLAQQRADAVQQYLLNGLSPELQSQVRVTTRTHVDEASSFIIGHSAQGSELGAILFETDKADIAPRFLPLIDALAKAIERQGGGELHIVGHTDVRASFEHNRKLGLDRAKAVYDALASRLSPATRARLHVESRESPAAPLSTEQN